MILRRRSSENRDRGSLSIEYVIITPMIFFVFALIYVFARIAEVDGLLDAGTRDAARVASVAPDYDHAVAAARQTVLDEIRNGSQTCTSTLRVTVSDNFAPGNTINVTASCTYPVSDAGVPGAPGTLTVHSQFSTVIDPNRSVG